MENQYSDEPQMIAALSNTEPPDAVTAARFALEDAFRKFKKRASAVNHTTLHQASRAYQIAQYEELQNKTASEYGKDV